VRDGRVLFVGDVSWDTTTLVTHVPAPDEKVLADDFVEGVGGVVANAAAAAALSGAAVSLACALPVDTTGAQVRQALLALGIDVIASASRGPLCRAVVLLDPQGEKRLMLWPGATMYPAEDLVAALDLRGVAWVHTAAYDAAAASLLADRCRQAGIPWSLDLEPATMPDGVSALTDALRGCRTVFVNARASAALGGSPVRRLLDMGTREIVLTQGPVGATWTDGSSQVRVPAPTPASAVRDTTGAGDALAGWYVSLRAENQTPAQALARAVLAATVSCAALGASPSYPRPDGLPLALVPEPIPYRWDAS
jgi:ribokinase